MEKKIWILPSFPTPNGDIHLGHLAGPLVVADIAARALQQRKAKGAFILGTVGHQSQVAVSAQKAGRSFYEEALYNTDKIRKSLAALDIRPDIFVSPDNPSYSIIVKNVFERARACGLVKLIDVPTHWCDQCVAPKFEALLIGNCPHCHSNKTAGIECEECALPFTEEQLVNPRCAACGFETRMISIPRYMMDMESMRTYLINHHKNTFSTPTFRKYVQNVLSTPLPLFPVTVPSDFGIRIEVENTSFNKQSIYSGFELVARFLTGVYELEADYDFDPTQLNGEIMLFFGSDNAYLRGVVFPALLRSIAPNIEITQYTMNEFYLLDGQKFSTSRNHAIWGGEYSTPRNRDWLRLYLSLTRPDTELRNFTVHAFEEFMDIHEERWLWIATQIKKASLELSAEATASLSCDMDISALYQEIKLHSDKLHEYLSVRTFDARLAALELMHIADKLYNILYAKHSINNYWMTEHSFRLFIDCMTPIMPSTASKLLSQSNQHEVVI